MKPGDHATIKYDVKSRTARIVIPVTTTARNRVLALKATSNVTRYTPMMIPVSTADVPIR